MQLAFMLVCTALFQLSTIKYAVSKPILQNYCLYNMDVPRFDNWECYVAEYP